MYMTAGETDGSAYFTAIDTDENESRMSTARRVVKQKSTQEEAEQVG